MIEHVVYFNRQLLGIRRDNPELLQPSEILWLISALTEEVQEFEQAHNGDRDLAKSVDALCDLIYFAIGGLCRLGLNEIMIAECFGAVHEANLQKKRGVKSTRPNDGTVADAVKPEGFVGPEERIQQVLDAQLRKFLQKNHKPGCAIFKNDIVRRPDGWSFQCDCEALG